MGVSTARSYADRQSQWVVPANLRLGGCTTLPCLATCSLLNLVVGVLDIYSHTSIQYVGDASHSSVSMQPDAGSPFVVAHRVWRLCLHRNCDLVRFGKVRRRALPCG